MSAASDTLALLQIAALAKDWPDLRSIHDMAMAELKDQAADASKELEARAEAAKAKADAEQAKLDIKAIPAEPKLPLEDKPNV